MFLEFVPNGIWTLVQMSARIQRVLVLNPFKSSGTREILGQLKSVVCGLALRKADGDDTVQWPLRNDPVPAVFLTPSALAGKGTRCQEDSWDSRQNHVCWRRR